MQNKWQLSKVGLVNFWYYQNQEFEFSQGHMLLRGTNGSGKSLTMQSFFPVLLDGNTNASRLDSFGSRSRKMEDYLLGEKGVSNRDEGIGYLYLELKRTNREEYLTVGLGLSARRGSRLSKWYFALEDNSRIGQDFQLFDRVGADEMRPFTQAILKNRIEGRGKIFKTRQEYKEYNNQHIFGFSTMNHFDELIELLINLRSPKLSRDFRPTVIYEILKNSLPKLKDEELLTLSQTIERLDRHRERIQEISQEIRDLKGFIRQYHAWHEELVGQISTKWLEFSGNKRHLEKINKELQNELEQLAKDSSHNEKDQTATENRAQVVEKTISNLADHEGFDLVRKGQNLQNELQILFQAITQLREKLADKQRRLSESQKLMDTMESQLYSIEKDLTNCLADNEQYLDDLRIHDLHAAYQEKMNSTISEAEFRYWYKEVQEKKHHFEVVIKELNELRLFEEQVKETKRLLGEIQREIDELKRDSDHWQQIRQSEIEQWKTLFDDWQQRSSFKLSAEEYNQVLFSMDQLYEEELGIEEVLRAAAIAYQRSLGENQEQRIPLEHQQKTCIDEKQRLELEIAEWQAEKIPVPPRSAARELSRQNIPENAETIAFYESVDFLPHVSEQARNHIEGALAASGMIDALITEEQLVLSDDVQIFANPQYFQETLENYLVVNSELSSKLQELVTNILQSILVGNLSETVPSITLEGEYQLVNLTGKMAQGYQAAYVGAASQARYRRMKIQELQEEIADLDQRIMELTSEIDQKNQLRKKMTADYQAIPKSQDVYEAIHQLQSLTRKLQEKVQDSAVKNKQLHEEANRVMQKKVQLQTATKDDGLLLTSENFERAQLGAVNYAANLNDAYLLYHQIQSQKEKLAMNQEMIANLQEDENDYQDQLYDNQQNHEKVKQLLEENQKQQQLLNIAEIKAALTAAYQEQEDLRKKVKQLDQESRRIFEAQTKARNAKEMQQQQLATVQEAELLWQQLLNKEVQRYELTERPLSDMAKEKVKEINVKYLKELENRFSARFNFLADNLVNYQPRLLAETSVELSDQQKREFGELENYNNQVLPRFEADGQRQSAFSLLQILQSQQVTMKDLLKKDDEELFKKIIMDSVGNILRQRIANAQIWVEKMNQLLISQQNSSGLSLSINWKELPATSDKDMGTRELVRLLQKPVEILSEPEKALIIQHFQEKIQYAQEQLQEEEEQTGILFQAVAQVLDYREWFVFELKFKRANKGYQWRPLTDHQFYIFSGGEKAVAMYLPLFAAVFSRYQDANPDCPYIITLDEAFAGIDEGNISELFKACEQLDFNYMMNSQALFGEYPTVSNLMTYQLIRPLNANIVSAIQYHWNGKVKQLILGDENNSK